MAVGASADLFFIGFERFGAKAEERRVAIFCLSQAVVMLSGKSLYKQMYLSAVVQDMEVGWRG